MWRKSKINFQMLICNINQKRKKPCRGICTSLTIITIVIWDWMAANGIGKLRFINSTMAHSVQMLNLKKYPFLHEINHEHSSEQPSTALFWLGNVIIWVIGL